MHETSDFLSAGKLLGSCPLHSNFAFPRLKISEAECFILQGQINLIQKGRSEANLRCDAMRAGGERAGMP